MQLSHRAQTVAPFHAMAITESAARLQAQGHRIITLSIGEPDFGAPPAVRNAMIAAMDGRSLPYTAAQGYPPLRAAIAGFYRDRHGIDVDPNRILITSGASAALLVITAATVNPGDEVILADPSYPCNRELIASFGGRAIAVPTTAAERFQLTEAAVRDAWSDRTAAVMIASPSNPTGTSIPRDALTRICRLAATRGAWRIVDEIYLDLADPDTQGRPASSVLSVDPEAIVISSFSKYFGMTGWRLGWTIVPESMTDAVERLAMNYFLCASAPAQFAALEAFSTESLELCEQRRVALLERRRLVIDGLRRIGFSIPVEPDGAFYVYFDVRHTGMNAWEFCERALHDAHVSLTPGRDFSTQPAGHSTDSDRSTADTHVRLSYAASQDDLEEGLERLARFCGGPYKT